MIVPCKYCGKDTERAYIRKAGSSCLNCKEKRGKVLRLARKGPPTRRPGRPRKDTVVPKVFPMDRIEIQQRPRGRSERKNRVPRSFS